MRTSVTRGLAGLLAGGLAMTMSGTAIAAPASQLSTATNTGTTSGFFDRLLDNTLGGLLGGGYRVNTTSDSADVRPGDRICADASGRCSLRAAVQEANHRKGATKITLRAHTTYRLTIAGPGEDAAATGDLDVIGRLSIRGNDARVDAGGLDRAFDVIGGRLDVDDLTVTGGTPPEGESGGGFRSTGTLKITDSVLHGNVVTGTGASGGGVFNDQGVLKIERSTLHDNAATRAGGGIEANAGDTRLKTVTLRANRTGAAPGNGGGLHVTGTGTVTVHRSLVEGNTAAAEGGGLWNSATGTMTVTSTRITDNSAPKGPDVFNVGGTFTIDGEAVPPTT